MNKYKFVYFFAVVMCLSLLLSCGRRGDPVAIPKYDKKPAAVGVVQKTAEDKTAVKDEISEKQLLPDAPKGLSGVYTGRNIVLVWDDVTADNLKGYNVYRTMEKVYKNIAYSFIPAYTDNEIKPGNTYYYKITALGVSEGHYSKAVKIKTERRSK